MIQLLNSLALQIIRNAYQTQDIATLNSLGMSQEDIKLIGDLDTYDLVYLQSLDLSIINTSIDISLLKKSIDRSRTHNRHQTLIRDAIILGATREIMRTYASLSYKQFNEIKKNLGITGQQGSLVINDDQTRRLDQLLKETTRHHPDHDKIKVRLPLLVELAKTTQISIRAILTHLTEYWSHHYEL